MLNVHQTPTKCRGIAVLAAVALVMTAMSGGPVGASPEPSSRVPANGLIAYDSDRSGDWEIYTMDPGGTNQTQLTTGGNHEFPAFSPDGTKIAYDDRTDVWVMDVGGSNQTNLTGSIGRSIMPSYSPDGANIAFASDRSGRMHIWVMNADGTGAKDITPKCKPWCTQPAWSPDGSKIAYSSNATGVGTLWVMSPSGSGKKNIYQDTASWPSWSPNGMKIAVVRGVKGGNQLWVMKASGKGAKFLIKENTGYGRAAWSPDGTMLALSRKVSTETNIWTANVDGTGLTNITGPGKYDDSPAWQAI